MSDLRTRMLELLEARGVDENSVADNLAMVVRGEKITERFAVVEGVPQLQEITKSRAPKDMALGAMLYDSLAGGHLGLAPKQLRSGAPQEAMYIRFAPSVDRRIIAGEAESVDPSQVMEAITKEVDPDEEF